MPIYAYKCESCGHSKDVLQKMSDAPLTDCPQCGAPAFKKQLTAAGFQLKGSGWYVTDFRGGNSAAAVPPANSGGGSDAPAAAPSGDSKPAESAGKTAAAPAPAPAASPAASSTPTTKTKAS